MSHWTKAFFHSSCGIESATLENDTLRQFIGSFVHKIMIYVLKSLALSIAYDVHFEESSIA